MRKQIEEEKREKEQERKERMEKLEKKRKLRGTLSRFRGTEESDDQAKLQKLNDRAYMTSEQFSSPMKEIPEIEEDSLQKLTINSSSATR